jgi:hypothetical protein
MPSKRLCLLSFACAVVSSVAIGQEPKPPTEQPPANADRLALEQEFQDMLTGAVLVGRYSVAGKENEGPAQEERYTMTRVVKLQGDVWLFTARLQFGEQDVTVPLPLEVKWAGDTPVLTVTDFAIPGLGTFTSRVMIYRGQYAGTWQHGDVGGHLWGRITKSQPDEKDRPGE